MITEIQRIHKAINSNKRLIEEYKAMAEKVTTTYSDSKSYGSSEIQDKMAELSCKIVDIEAENKNLKCRLLEAEFELFWATETMQEDERSILRHRYIHQESCNQIIKLINVSRRHYFRVHKEALKNLALNVT